MILVADAGGTSIKWRGIKRKEPMVQAQSLGFNAQIHTSDQLEESILEAKKQLRESVFEKIFFYGAGVQSNTKQQVVDVLNEMLPASYYEIKSDLLGCARSVLGNQVGVACILGTGSNSCFYNGNEITQNLSPLGYILGDEGSGSALGKKLIKAYYRGLLPLELHKAFENKYQLSQANLLSKVYADMAGSSFLASFSKFLFHHRKHPFIYQMIYHEFDQFMKNLVAYYMPNKDYVASFSGSIAFYYADILRQVGNDNGIRIQTIVEDPIAGLSLFHEKRDL